jgi:hypothetical protein
VEIRDRKVVPVSVAKELLNVSESQWRALVAQRVVDVSVTHTGRGHEQKTNFASIERAATRR